jgi:hypothetical protein
LIRRRDVKDCPLSIPVNARCETRGVKREV